MKAENQGIEQNKQKNKKTKGKEKKKLAGGIENENQKLMGKSPSEKKRHKKGKLVEGTGKNARR